MMQGLSIEFVQSAYTEPTLLGMSNIVDIDIISPLLTHLASLNPTRSELASHLAPLQPRCETRKFLPYFLFNSKEFIGISTEIQKISISEVEHELKNDCSASAISHFEQNMKTEEQISFVFKQLLLLKRLICLEKSSVPREYTFHICRYESLTSIMLNSLIVIFDNRCSSQLLEIEHLVAILIAAAVPWSFARQLVFNMPNNYLKMLHSAMCCPLNSNLDQVF